MSDERARKAAEEIRQMFSLSKAYGDTVTKVAEIISRHFAEPAADTEHGASSEELGKRLGAFYEPAPPEPAEPEAGCTDCGHGKDDPRFHFDAPGNNWGGALHWFRPRAEPEAGAREALQRLLAETGIASINVAIFIDKRGKEWSLPKIVTYCLRAHREREERLRQELIHWGYHEVGCAAWPIGGRWRESDATKCTCGLAAAIRKEVEP